MSYGNPNDQAEEDTWTRSSNSETGTRAKVRIACSLTLLLFRSLTLVQHPVERLPEHLVQSLVENLPENLVENLVERLPERLVQHLPERTPP